ncbi:MAG: hypothetical protein NC548_51980 [Lachnospiraceae bacterium]|nr:hypothetical protein [Lachnospiraceae bacterium]
MKCQIVSIVMVALSLGCFSAYAQRINADGRKMVKTVKYYEWKGEKRGFVISDAYSMEYNDKAELVRLYHDKCNGLTPVSYIRKGDNLILKDGNGIKCEYKFDSHGHVTSATEFYLPLSKNGIEPYYVSLDFTYNPDGTLFSLVSRTLYNTTGRQYKENREDRDVIQFEYRDGGMYSFVGGVNSKGNEYLHPFEEGVREYDTYARYDINFNIEAREFARCFREYMPFCTEWSPTFPKYMIHKIDKGGYYRYYNYDYDQNGNVTSITISHSIGRYRTRYEIEYVY